MITSYLFTVAGVTNPETVVEANLESIERWVMLPTGPTWVGGVANTIIGPPVAATPHEKDEAFVDKHGAQFICTASGSPGTWKQLRPAMMAADPVAGTFPAGYRIWRTDLNAERITLAGGTPGTWADFIGARNVTLLDAVNLIIGTGTGTKIGTSATQKIGFFGAAPVVRQANYDEVDGTSTLAEVAFSAEQARQTLIALGLIG